MGAPSQGPYRTSAPPSEDSTRAVTLRERGLEVMLLAVGVIPLVGILLGARFTDFDTTIGLLFVGFAAVQLCRRT